LNNNQDDLNKKKRIKSFEDEDILVENSRLLELNKRQKKELDEFKEKLQKIEEEKKSQKKELDKLVEANLLNERQLADQPINHNQQQQTNKQFSKTSLFFACVSTAAASVLLTLFLKDKILLVMNQNN
jgi:predicted nuclease with TOPRIM domain